MAQLFLIAPADAGPEEFAGALGRILQKAEVAAVLLPRGPRPEKAYREFVKAVTPVAQEAGCAVLIEGEPGLVKTLGADGLHVTGGATALREAVAALKPGSIVGAGDVHSRHDAMTLGEMDADYILFGPLSGPISAAERDLAQWWAETMEIPSVLCDAEANLDTCDAAGCEFVGLSTAALEAQP